MSSEQELRELAAQLQSSGGVPGSEPLRQFLKLCREVRAPNSELVARYGVMLLQHHRKALAEDELWLVHEQVATAALECGACPLAAQLIRAVLQRFPEDSVRAKRLQGMFYEAQGKVPRAEEFYHGIIEQQPTNQMIAKRLVAAARTKGDLPAAVEYLRTYLDHWMNDRDAWEELAELYLEMGLYRQAAFCLEEVLTLAPSEPNVAVRYADALLTLGGAANARTARAYYSRAVTLTQGRSARALYGLVACAAQLQGQQGGSSDAGSNPEAQELPGAAAAALVALYRERAPGKVPLVEALLKRQGLV
ncbi:hypothetical protein Rsub_01302 [Raphidocelis subcapitata]|uniref:ER membrane protein complex subunit 2 n=1 Tax=Raphidocelis subcapitata TaxID=307507 RepID=A0A2V0NUI0_9CHLO|nr:hypothetical protein Rsub_01302 [Raphidocelis subcapitata]|eukprot:GBF88587.1 hypothetical protein Rsub_01302 [Raphidocelis subcapitata]